MKRNGNNKVSYKDRVCESERDRKGKDEKEMQEILHYLESQTMPILIKCHS